MTRRRGRLALIAAAGVIVVAACSSDEPADQVIVPLESAPSGWVESSFEGVTVTTPEGWEESSGEDPENDAVTRTLQADFNDHGTRGGLGLIVLSDPDRDASAFAESIETSYGAVLEIVSDVEREEVSWPGAEAAWFVDFTADMANDDGERAPHVIQHLILDLEDGTQIQANVSGLASDFDEQNFADVLASLSVTG